MLSFFSIDEIENMILDEACEEYECAECEMEDEFTDIEASLASVDDFIDQSIEDEVIEQEDIDIAVSELLDDYDTECEMEDDGAAYTNDDGKILNPFKEKLTVEDWMNDY